MTSPSIATVVAAKALDGLTMRMGAIAQNIANANSAQFQPVTLRFEDALRAAALRGADAVDQLQFAFEADSAIQPGDDRRLDLALADASETSMRFEALAGMLARRLALAHVLTGGQ